MSEFRPRYWYDLTEEFEREHPLIATGYYVVQTVGVATLLVVAIVGVVALLSKLA